MTVVSHYENHLVFVNVSCSGLYWTIIGFSLFIYNTFKIQLNLELKTAQSRKDPKTKRSKNERR